MCGRYVSARKRQELIDAFDLGPERAEAHVEPDYNVAPTKSVPVVLTRRPDSSAESADGPEPVRQLLLARWGLVPAWAKDIKLGAKMINARSETVHEKPSFRRAFARQRCLLPADGYYEWYAKEAGGKQPFFLRPADGSLLAMAGLYELWREETKPGEDPDAWLLSCTVITTTATDEAGRVHERMPMTIAPDHWQAWLDPTMSDREQVRALMAPPVGLDIFPVSTAVNSVRNNGPALTEPLPATIETG